MGINCVHVYSDDLKSSCECNKSTYLPLIYLPHLLFKYRWLVELSREVW